MTDHVILHVDELVLHGFAAADRHRIADAVQRELGRLLADGAVPGAWWSGAGVQVGSLDAGSFEISAQSRPDRIGGQIAQAVYDGFDSGEQR